MSDGALVCARCGDILTGERVLVADLDLCGVCLEPHGERSVPKRDAESVPLWFGAALVVALLASVVAGGIVGAQVAKAVGSSIDHGVGLGALQGVIVIAGRLGSLDALLKAAWKLQTARELGLAHLPLERMRFAYVLRAAQAGGKWIGPTDGAFVIESESAFVILGREGRSIVSLGDVTGVGAVGMRGHWWVRLELGDGAVVCISIQEGSTAFGAHEATQAFGGRIYLRVEALAKARGEPAPDARS